MEILALQYYNLSPYGAAIEKQGGLQYTEMT